MEWGATDKELVQSWMAFKELHRRGLVIVGIATMHKPGMHPRDYGWTDKWGGLTDKKFMNRMFDAPEDFRLAHDVFGADIMSPNYHCLNPGHLPRMLAEHLGVGDIETLFDPSEVTKEVARLSHARQNQKKVTVCPHCGKEI